MSALFQQKAALRAAMREALRAMSEESRREQSEAACKVVLALEAFQRAKTVLLYRALPIECNPAAIAAAAQGLGKRVAYPVCGEGRTLGFYVPQSEDAFLPASFGILEPDTSRSVEVLPDEADLVLVPGLAFDRFGGRLGRGAGYYDRFLSQTKAHKVGFTFEEQLVERVPMEAFDVKMDCVAVSKWIYCE